MIKRYLILFQVVLSVCLITSLVFAAPNINDGFMSYSNSDDWGSLGVVNFEAGSNPVENNDDFSPSVALTNVSVEENNAYGDTFDNNQYYDVEELGVYINENLLYIGIQTNFNLLSGRNNVVSGDFIFNFDESSDTFSDNADADDFAFDFTIDSTDGSVDFTLLTGNLTGGTTTSINNYDKDWEKIASTNTDLPTLTKTFYDAGLYTVGNNGDDNDYYYNGGHTIEAVIDLSQLEGQLRDVFLGYADAYDSVTMFWQPSCGNDFLAARSDFAFTTPDGSNAVPEPATLLLFGMGLLGAGAYGRKRQKIEDK